MSLAPLCGSVELPAFQQHVLASCSKGERLDGRSRTDVRSVAAQRNVVDGAVSSVLVSCGSGLVQCAVKGAFGPPTRERPNAGRLHVHVDIPFAPMHLPATRECRAQIEAFLSSVLESTVDLEPLCVVPEEACWVVYVDLTILSADGSLRSLCLDAVTAALRYPVVLPRARLPNGDYSTPAHWGLDVSKMSPMAVTAGSILGGTVVDTSGAEECVADALVTVVVNAAGNEVPQVLLVEHHGGHPCHVKVLEIAVNSLWNAKSTRVNID